MSAPLSTTQARAIGQALIDAATEAEAAGKSEIDYTEVAFNDLDVAIAEAQAAVDAAKAAGP